MMFYSGWQIFYPVVILLSGLTPNVRTEIKPPVVSDKMSEACRIFCRGKLLHYVQMSRVFNDSKYFVDMKLKNSQDETENRFNDLLNKTKDSPSQGDLRKFIDDNFVEPGTEFNVWNPVDWKPVPKFTYEIYDLQLRNWVRDLVIKWKSLGRRISPEVKDNSDLYSQIFVPNPFIVPGGRFRELYYWDSYWIIEGLLLSEMDETARGMIENFIYLIEEYGYVPNGSRKYYLGRSQPPFLILMVDLYWKHSKDTDFLKKYVDVLEKEFEFWKENRSVEIKVDDVNHLLFHYKVLTTTPRPESYFEDVNLVKNVDEVEEKQRLYSELKSGAESGWDFSSRWFINDEKHTVNMSDISTSHIAPVCLNSLMSLNAKLLSDFYDALGNSIKQKKFENLADKLNSSMSRVFWSERDGVWLDYNLKTKKLIPGFYPSNLMPLWTESFGEERDRDFVIEQAISYLERNLIEKYPGGIPASLVESGQQWDLPNGWAPSQYFVVMGLHKAGRDNERAREMSYDLARSWILNVYQTYLNSKPHAIYEKYNVTQSGGKGGGGEYQIQEGFGWTNAVVMKLLSVYGHKVKTQDVYDPAPALVGILLTLVSVVSVINYMNRVKSCKRLTWKTEEV